MGRRYFGDIEGYFTFASQSSYDPSFFYISDTPEELYYYPCCNKRCKEAAPTYCPTCKDSQEKVGTDGMYIYYNFQNNKQQQILMEKQIKQCFDVLNISKEEQNIYFQNEHEGYNEYMVRIEKMIDTNKSFQTNNRMQEWAARLLLGLNINYALRNKNKCELYCET